MTPPPSSTGNDSGAARGAGNERPIALPPVLRQLERMASQELAQLQAALPASSEDDPLLVTLAWDLGLSGTASATPTTSADYGSGRRR